jgi:hypothetical protein
MEKSKDGFRTIKRMNGNLALLFDSERVKECCQFALKNKILIISLYPGVYVSKDLSPLFEIKDFIEGLMLDENLEYSKLSSFKYLKFLSIPDNKKDIIDLSNFPELETLAFDFSDRLKGLDNTKKLKSVTINNYKSKNKNLSSLPSLPFLEHFNLVKPNINSLHGIEKFTNLKRLEIYGASKLEIIGDISKLIMVEQISIEKSKNIRDFEALKHLPNLKKLMLTESGKVNSLSFVKKLHKLEFISFWGSNILDGNITYCEDINYVGFDNKKHYTHKSEHFKNKT